MKAKEIQELIDFISNSGLAEVKIETDEFKLSIKKNSGPPTEKAIESSPVQIPGPPPPAPPSTSQSFPTAPTDSGDASKLLEVKSPMIGTFYRTQNPDSDPFVNVGDTITAGQTVCIIEAMKLFNEIESEVTGKVVKILVENSSPVEYDQPLFLIDPAG
ncbi:MAG: acetyl-CoA carboxylase biotin carboxyl carrier protein [Anditalea sp.]